MEATMPRSLPQMTGLPFSFGSRACSQEAEKASPSIWTMARGKPWMDRGASCISIFSDNAPYHCGHAKLFLRNDGFEGRVCGVEDYLPSLPPKIFHGPLAVDLGDRDIAFFGLLAPFHQDLISGQNPCIYHGSSGDFENVCGFSILDQIFVEGHRVDELLLSGGGPAGFYHAQHR